MRVSLNWLKDYVAVDTTPEDLAHLLTMNSLEVEMVEPCGHGLEPILAAKILAVDPHPNADRLRVCLVDAGEGEVPVVCGAPNAREGLLAPIALPGTRLPGGIVIKETRIRGQKSFGMLLAEDEMGLTDDHRGLMELPSNAEPGTSVSSLLPLEDWVLEVAITPNRSDCTSIIGIAREVAALTGQELKRPEIALEEGPTPIETLAQITIEDPVGCPRYSAGMVSGVELRPSPFWMRYRLHLCGMRGISNIVDITNYVLLEMGQPLHAFDYDTLADHRIVVRRARDGESFVTLDEKTHTLNGNHLMICDGERSVGLAGIMGGLNTEISSQTKNILIESACFDPVTIRRGAKQVNISSEAAYRFERGIDIENVTTALRRALSLTARMSGGEIAKGIIDVYPRPFEPAAIDLRIDRTEALLGVKLTRERVAGYLRALQMDVQAMDDNTLCVKPPAFRVDVLREVDLVEEVARLEGYDRIPVTPPPVRPVAGEATPVLFLSNRPRDIMVGMGFTEILSYSFISPEAMDLLGIAGNNGMRKGVRLLNPLTVDQSVMRTSLVPGILAAVRNNAAHGDENLRLFEWGDVYLPEEGGELPSEPPYLTGILTGNAQARVWYEKQREIDFFDAKGVLEVLFEGLGLKGVEFKRGAAPPYYAGDLTAFVEYGGQFVGYVGKLSPGVLERFEIKLDNAYLFEVKMEALLEDMRRPPTFVPFSRFPAVIRDVSVLLPKAVDSGSVTEIIREEGGELLETAELYDVFEGGTLDPGEKALTYRLHYRSREGTLDGKAINRLHEAIIKKIQDKAGGRLREG